MFGFTTQQEYVTIQDFNTFTKSINNIIKEKEDIIKNLFDRIEILEQQYSSLISLQEKYPFFYNGFTDFLTIKQLEYLVPKIDRIGKSKRELVESLFTTIKRKTADYNYNIEEIFTDRFKFTVELINYLTMYNDEIKEEWKQLIKDNSV